MRVHEVECLRLHILVVRVIDERYRHTYLIEETLCARRSIQGITFLHQLTGSILQSHFVLRAADGEQDRFLRDTLSDRKHRLQQSMVGILAETTYLTRRSHIHTQHGVGILETVEGELRSLHAHIVEVEQRLGRFLHRQVEHNTCGYINQVDFQHLTYKRERTGSTEVALDDLNLVVASKELDIERPRNLEFAGDITRNLLDTTDSLHIEFLCGEHNRGIARVYSRKLHMLRDGVGNDFAIACHSVHLHLLGIEHKLGDYHRVLLGNIGSELEELGELLIVETYIHRCAGKHIRRTHQDREADLIDEALHIVHRSECTPFRLVHANTVEHGGELITVLGIINTLRRSTQNRHTLCIQFER